MSDAIPGLLIVLPLVAATLPLLVGLLRERVGLAVATVVLVAEAGLAGWLAWLVYGEGQRVVHVLGGATFGRKDVVIDGQSTEGFIVGIELVADALSGLVVLLIAVVALAVLAYAHRAGPRGNAFYSGYLLLTGGLMGVALTGDLFNLFVFLEITGLATYALVASDDSPAAAVASLKYLFIGTVGASLYLVGVGYVFVRTGTLNMVDVSRSLAGSPAWIDGPLYAEPLVAASFAFIAIGLATKAAIFPLHTWQPDAYASAPDAVTVYISALVSTSAAYAFARITWFVYTPAFFEVNRTLLNVVLVAAAVSVLAGSVVAAMQRRVKRTFAYSSVAQFGLLFIGIAVAVHPAAGESGTRFAIYGVVIHLVGHGVTKAGLFATAGALASGADARQVREYAGLAKRHPFLAGSLAVLGFSIIGVPPTIGFVGKWYIALGAVNTELWGIIVVVFASTLLTLLYVAQLLEKLYFDYAPGNAPAHAEASGVPAADGATAADGGTVTADDSETAADGGTVATDGTLSYGMIALALGAAVAVVVLGFLGAELTTAVDPVVDAVLAGSPEVMLNG